MMRDSEARAVTERLRVGAALMLSVVVACSSREVGGSAGSTKGRDGGASVHDAGRRDSGGPGSGGRDAGRVDAGPVAPGCAAVDITSDTPFAPDGPGTSLPSVIATWAGDGPVAVWPAPGGLGTRAVLLDATGIARAPVTTLWPDQPSAGTRLAVAGETLAIVGQASEGVNARQTCRIAFAHLPDLAPVQGSARFSDPPTDTILNEVSACDVVRLGSDLLAVWLENTSDTSLAWSLYAQRFGAAGASTGARLVLASGDGKVANVSVASSGDRAFVAYTASTPQSAAIASLAIVGDTGVRTVEPGIDVALRIAFAQGHLIAQGGARLWELDRDGAMLRGPVPLPGALVAPLGAAWVSVTSESFLVARALNGAFAAASPAAGLGSDRRATAQGLVYAPDGSATLVGYSDASGNHLARLACGTHPGPPPGPPSCPAQASVPPLGDGCTDPVCHAVIRLDYLTLGLRGYATVGGAAHPVDATGAGAAAGPVFAANGLSNPATVSGPRAGLFRADVSPGDFGGFALVAANSGVVVTAGGVVWAGRGKYWAPDTWKPPGDLACGDARARPAELFVDPGDCVGFDGTSGATPSAALDVALRTNLAQHYAARGPFKAYVYLYTPTVGGCDAAVAEYVVVLTG